MPTNPADKAENPEPSPGPRTQGSLAGTILAAFDVACDAHELAIARMLLRTLEGVLAARPGPAGVQAVLTVARTRLQELEQDQL